MFTTVAAGAILATASVFAPAAFAQPVAELQRQRADIVQTITGVQVKERVPDRVVDEADEVELIDMSPNALRQRIRHGNVYPPERAAADLRECLPG